MEHRVGNLGGWIVGLSLPPPVLPGGWLAMRAMVGCIRVQQGGLFDCCASRPGGHHHLGAHRKIRAATNFWSPPETRKICIHGWRSTSRESLWFLHDRAGCEGQECPPAPKQKLRASQRRPPCRIRTSQRNCWITSSTTCTARNTRSRDVVSFLNHGSPALESTFSPTSSSTKPRSCNHGRTRFQIPPPPLRVTPNPCSFTASKQSRPRTQTRTVGFQPFLALCTWRWAYTASPPTTRHQSLLSPSTDSHPSLNPFASLLPSFSLRVHSISSAHSLFSRTSPCPPTIPAMAPVGSQPPSNPRTYPRLLGLWSFIRRRGQGLSPVGCCPCQAVSTSGNSI
jgi:hypothetical protein